MSRHYTKLPTIAGYVRIADRIGSRRRYDGTLERVVIRMMRCEIDHAEIPTLGRGYHERSRKHRDAARTQFETELGRTKS